MTRRQLLRLLAAAPALAVTGCTAQSASSQQEKPLILRYAENQPEDYPTSKAAKAFAELVAQRTGGRVKVLVYSGAELGAEQSVIQQMQFGGVDFSRVSLSQLAEYEPELSVLQLPYLYSDAQQMWRVLDGGIGDEFLAMLDDIDADIVFMDFSMPGLDGAQTTERALARRPDLRIITLSMFGEESYYTRMVQAGARGFLLKDSDIGDVVEAIDTVMAGGSYFSPQLLSSLAGRLRTREDAPDEELSAREREILVAVCRGLSNQEIADELFISKRTVDKHRANILEKTGCKNTASLVVYAIRKGIVEI